MSNVVLPQICNDIKITVSKLNRGAEKSPVNTLIEKLVAEGANNSTEINIVEIPKRERHIVVRLDGEIKKIEVLSEEEFNQALERQAIPMPAWYDMTNHKLKLKLGLHDNVKKAKSKIGTVK